MYNEEQKERYLKERELQNVNIRTAMSTFFSYTEEFEERLNKDCSNFTVDEIINMYKKQSTYSRTSLINFNSQMSIYTYWCMNQNLVADNQNHYAELDKNDLLQCLNLALMESMVITREDLEKTIRAFPNPSDSFLALAVFEGLGGVGFSDFMNLTMKNFNGNEVSVGKRTLTLTDLAVSYAEKSAYEFQKFAFDRELKQGYKADDPSIIKDCHNAGEQTPERHRRKIYSRLFELEKEYGKAFSYAGLRNSGRISMLNNYMTKENSTNPYSTYQAHKKEFEYRYGKIRFTSWLEENKQYINK